MFSIGPFLTRTATCINNAVTALRQDPTTFELNHRTIVSNRSIDPTAANLIASHVKVMQYANGQIPIPDVVELFITNFCNFACPHCRCSEYHGKSSEFINFGTMERLLDDLSKAGVKNLEFGGGGEPFSHPQVIEIFRKLNEEAFRTGIITNGYALTQKPELADIVSGCSDWVRFSLDGISDDVFRVVHGRKDISYSALREAMAALIRQVKSKPTHDQRPKVGMKLIIQGPNKDQILDSVDEALDLGMHYLQFKFLEDHPFALPQGQERAILIKDLTKRIRTIPKGVMDVDVLPGYGGPRIIERCKMSILHPLIDWDGEIYMCAFYHHRKDRHSIGNINDQGFFAHWGSEKHREKIKGVNPMECVPNCPMLRYNPVVDFITREDYRFPYI